MSSKKWIYGKNVVITGASSGLGFHIAKLLASRYSCNIIGTGRSETKLIKAKEEIDKEVQRSKTKETEFYGSFNYKIFDVSNNEDWVLFKNYLNQINFKVDVVINNAGVMLPFEKFETQKIEEVEALFKTNFFSHVYSYKTFIEDLKKNRGALINISSSSALCPVVGCAIYSASKAATKNFTEAIAVEHKKEVYISVVCPGFTKTELFRKETKPSKFMDAFSMKAPKMAKKIVKGIVRKKKRMVFGTDAHFMSGLYRIAPKATPSFVGWVLDKSKDPMFDKVFVDNK